MKTKSIKQSSLTGDCWLIQMWGIEKCGTCEALNTKECGGKAIREQILSGKYPVDGLPDQTKGGK